MLDWFSQSRIGDQRKLDWPPPPRIGQTLPDFAFKKSTGTWFFLSELRVALAMLVLPSPFQFSQAQWLQSLATKTRQVRRSITRAVVVTPSEHLSTVVALRGDMLILGDDHGDVVLQLAPEGARLYLVGPQRDVRNIVKDEVDLSLLAETGLDLAV